MDGTGHVSAATSVTKSDITALGIPAQDTVTEVVDNLTSTDAGKALSAKQGNVLNNLVSTVSGRVDNLDTTNIKLPADTATLYGLSGTDANADIAFMMISPKLGASFTSFLKDTVNKAWVVPAGITKIVTY